MSRKEKAMQTISTFPEHLRRCVAHIYAALRECIADEVEYDREPDFAPLDEETLWAVWNQIYARITQLMVEAHTEEAAVIDADVEAHTVYRPLMSVTDTQGRLLAHLYALLREQLTGAETYTFPQDVAQRAGPEYDTVVQRCAAELTALMVMAHAEEAAKIEAEIAALHGSGVTGA